MLFIRAIPSYSADCLSVFIQCHICWLHSEQKVSGSCCLSLWIQYNGASWSQVCCVCHPGEQGDTTPGWAVPGGRAQLDLHSWRELLLLLLATGPLGWAMSPQVMAGLRVEPVELRAARDDPQNPRVTGRLCPVPWPILDVLPEPLGSPGWVLWQECAMLLAQGLACALCVTYGVLLPAMCRHPWHPRGDEAGMCQAGAALQPGGRGEGSGGELRGLWFPAQLRWSPGHQPRDGAELLWGCSSSS